MGSEAAVSRPIYKSGKKMDARTHEAFQMRLAGATFKEIAKKLGLKTPTAAHELVELGIDILKGTLLTRRPR
jgi:hypothetical protein